MKRSTRTQDINPAATPHGYIAAVAGMLVIAGCTAPRPQAQPAVMHPSLADIARLQNPTSFIGEGRLSHAPEYIELTVTVHAECYQTPMDASRAADKAVASVMAILRGAIDPDNPRDGVFSQGGFSRAFSRYENNRTVCRDTFAKTSTVTMKTSRIADVAARYPELQQQILTTALSRPQGGGSDRSITYAALAAPQPRLYHETRERLEQQALAAALVNARRKFEVTAAAGCGTGQYGILRVEETSVDAARPIPYARSQPRDAAGSALELDAIWINKLLTVSFTTEPGTCGPRATGRADRPSGEKSQ